MEWKYSFEDLPKEESGKEIVYTISENEVPNYKVSFEGANIINTYTEETNSETETGIVTLESSTKPVTTNKNKLPKTGIVALTGITVAGLTLMGLGSYNVFKKNK